MVVGYVPDILNLNHFDTLPAFLVESRGPGTYRKKMEIQGNSLLSSIFVKSKMSSMILRSERPERLAVTMNRCCFSVRDVWPSNSNIPRTPFMGVRISWLIVARNRLLARFAAWAASLAASSLR